MHDRITVWKLQYVPEDELPREKIEQDIYKKHHLTKNINYYELRIY